MADSFDSLLGPTYKAPTVPAPDAVISQTPTPIFDSLVETPRSPAPASPETPIFNSLAGTGNQPSSVTPIFDSIMQTEKPPGSDTPIFDQITKEMDGSTPTPSLGDLLIPRTPPVTVPPPAPEEPGYLSTIGQGLYSGFRRRLPEMVGQGMQFTGLLPEEGKAMAEWAREGEQRPEFKNPLKDWLYQGVEMLAPSVAVPLALSATGAGVLPASLAAGALFGLSQAQQTKETAEKAGVAPGMAPYATGGIEALGETAGTIALQRLFGPLAPVVSKGGKVAIRDIIKPGFSRLMREFFGVTIPVEVGTEIGQQAGEAAVEKYTGIRPDADILREALSVIGPTAVLSAMTLGMAHPLNRIMSRRFETALSDPNVPREIRQQAVDSVSSVLSDADPNLGGLWKIRGTEAVMNGQPIPMDRDVFDWITAKPQTPPGAPAVQPTPPETAAPTLPTTAPGMIPGREAIIQNPPEKTTKGTAINIEPGRPVQPDTVDMEAWQAMKQGRWMDFIGQNIQPEALSQIEQIQKDLGLVVKDGKVFQVGPNGEAIPLSPEKEEAATWALTHRLRVVDDFLKFINQAPLTTEIPKQITGGVNWIPGRPKTILRPGPGIEPPPGEGGFTAGQVQNPKVYVRTPKGNLALVRNPNIPIPSNLPQEGTLPKPLVTTPGVNPAPQPPPAPIQAAPEKPPVTATHLGGPEWMKIGKQAEFYDDKFGRNRVGTISDIIYQGEPPQPSSVTISAGMGKKQRNIELKSDQVNEPTHAVRRKEYFAALQGLKAQERKDTIAGSKQFDNLLIQNAELFVDPGYIDFVYSTAQSDKQKALATHDILDQARAEAGKALKIQDVYNPIRRAENLQTLRDYIEGKRPGGGVAAAHMEAAGNLPMGKNTVLKDGEWLDVSYDEESGKIVLKDGRKFSVAPEEKVEVEQTRVPKETAPTTVPAAEKPAPPPEAPKPPAKPPTPTQQLQARVAIKDLRTGEVFTGSTHADIVMEHGLTPGQGGTEWSAGYEVGGNFYKEEKEALAAIEKVGAEVPQRLTPTGNILPEQARRLEEIRKENPEEAVRIEKGNVTVGIQQYELARMGKAKQMRQEEMLTQPKAQEELLPAPEQVGLEEFLRIRGINSPEYMANLIRRALQPDFGLNSQYYLDIKSGLLNQGRLSTKDFEKIEKALVPLPQSWIYALRKNRTAQEWMSFISENSLEGSQQLLADALLKNEAIRKQMEALPITTFEGQSMSDSGEMSSTSYYDGVSHMVRLKITDFFRYSDKEAGKTVLHEVIHGLTHQKMKLDPNVRFVIALLRTKAIKGLSAKERDIAMDNTALMRSVEKIQGLGLVEQHFDVYYGLQNDSEFLAEVFTSPHMQKYLKSLPAEEAVGHLTRRSLWDQFIDFLNHIFFGEKNHQNLLSQTLNLGAQIVEAEKIKWRRGKIVAAVPEMGGTQPILEVPHAALPENMQINLDGLTHDAFPGNVAGDSKFDPYLAKYRFLIHLTDPDLKKWQEIGVLPFWLAKEHAEFKPFLQTQERREEKRSELKTEWFKRKEGFTFLRGDNLSKTEEALIAGDAEGKVWTDSQLTERFNLSPEGITAYKAVRATLDGIFQENLARAEAAILDNARRTIDSAFDKLTSQIESHKASEQKDVILDLLRTAHDLPLSDEETTHLANLLGETQQATEKPLKTVKNKLVKIFNEILTEKDKAKLLTDFEGAYEKTQAQIGDIREIIHNALGGDVDRANLDQITKGLVHAYLRTERPATTLKELRAEFGKAKGYFPRDHGRGKYEIFVTQDTFDDLGQAQKRVLWNHFYDQIAGTRAYMQLKKDPEFNQPGMEIGIRLHKEEPDSSFWRASLANLQRLTDNSIEELKRKGTIPPEWAEGLRFQILYELSDQFKARGAARHFIHRADFLIGGYKTTGLNEVLNDYISGWSGMITKQDAAGEFLEAMKGIPADKPKLKNYAFQYTENQLRNDEQTDRVLGKLRGLVFTYFLGGSLRGALVNSTQSLTMTAPWLAREVGWKGLRAEKLVLSSAVDIATNRLSVVERRLLDDAHDKGATEAQYINSVISEGGDRFGKTTGKIIALLAKPFAFFETKNRQIAALSYFRAKFPDMIKTMTEEEVYQKLLPESIDFVNKTQFMMSKGNLPNWASGGDVGSQFFRTAYTFRKFNHNYLLSLRNSFRGPDGKVALDVIGRSLAYVVLLGGLPAIPFLDDLLDEWEKIFGQPVRREIKRNLSVIGGPALEKMGMMGIPAIVGIDISGSLKMGIPFVGGPSESVFGVWAGLGQKFMNAKDSAGKGEVLRAIESASPAFLESMLKAYRMTEQGATTATGKIIYDEKGQPIKETIGEGITQAFGFRPERISEASKTHREFANIESNFRNRMDDLYARFRLAKDAGERKKVILDIQKYNLEAIKYRGAVPMINVQNLRQSFISKPEKKYLLWGAQK